MFVQKYRKLQISCTRVKLWVHRQPFFFFFALLSSVLSCFVCFFVFFLQKINLLNLCVDGIWNPSQKQPRHTLFLFPPLLCSRGALRPSLGTLLCSSLAPLSHDHLNSRKVVTYSINTVVKDGEEKFKEDGFCNLATTISLAVDTDPNKMSATSAPECFCSANIQLFMFMQFKKPPQSSCLNVVF